jgi:hypothetical protein
MSRECSMNASQENYTQNFSLESKRKTFTSVTYGELSAYFHLI